MTTIANQRPRTVYFIKPIGMDGPIKIGCSISPDNRRQSLEEWSPFPLEVVAEIDGDLMLEARFHGQFRAEALRREWFTASPRLLATIERIRSGKFDIAELPQYGPGLRPPRRKKDTSYITPEWRYERSVLSRVSRRFQGREYWSRLHAVLDIARPHGFLAKRSEIERFLVEPYTPTAPRAPEKAA